MSRHGIKDKIETLKQGYVFWNAGDRGDQPEITIPFTLEKRTCSFCQKEWLALYIAGLVAYGGSRSTMEKGEHFEHCGCQSECLGEMKNG